MIKLIIIGFIVFIVILGFITIFYAYKAYKYWRKAEIIIDKRKTPSLYWVSFLFCIALIGFLFYVMDKIENDFLVFAISPLVGLTILFFALFSMLKHESEVDNGPLKKAILTGKSTGGGIKGEAGAIFLHTIYLVIKEISNICSKKLFKNDENTKKEYDKDIKI